MELSKVKLPKEVADAIERIWFAVKDELATMHMRLTNWNFLLDEVKGHQVLDTDLRIIMDYGEFHPLEYIQALVNGYEVEQTPEDKVKEQYNNPRHFVNKDRDTYADVYRKGIIFALDTLSIKISGVNVE